MQTWFVPLADETPRLFGAPTADIALVVSLLALVVSVVSGFVAVKTYRRGGARIKVTTTEGRLVVNDPSAQVVMAGAVSVAVANSGLAPITVRNVVWQWKKGTFGFWQRKDAAVFSPTELAKWPVRIDGQAEAEFTYPRDLLVTNFALADKHVTIRPTVALATGSKRRGDTVRLDATTLPVSGQELHSGGKRR